MRDFIKDLLWRLLSLWVGLFVGMIIVEFLISRGIYKEIRYPTDFNELEQFILIFSLLILVDIFEKLYQRWQYNRKIKKGLDKASEELDTKDTIITKKRNGKIGSVSIKIKERLKKEKKK